MNRTVTPYLDSHVYIDIDVYSFSFDSQWTAFLQKITVHESIYLFFVVTKPIILCHFVSQNFLLLKTNILFLFNIFSHYFFWSDSKEVHAKLPKGFSFSDTLMQMLLVLYILNQIFNDNIKITKNTSNEWLFAIIDKTL